MFGSSVILQEFTVLDCAVNPLYICSICILAPWCVCFSVLHPKPFSLLPVAASKEPGLVSPFMFASLSICAVPHLIISVPCEVAGGVAWNPDYCDHRWLLFSFELA